MKPILPFIFLLPIIGVVQSATAATTTPLFDSGGTSIIGGFAPSAYPYNAEIAPTTGTQTYYFSLGTGNGSNTSPWGGSNSVTDLNLSLWAYSATGSAVPVTVGIYTGTNNGGGLSGLTEIGSLDTGSINNTAGGLYNDTASTFSFGLTGNTDPITANSQFIVGITVTAGSPLDLAIGAPLGGTPTPNYTFSNAFTGSTGLNSTSYLYNGGNGVLTSLAQTNTNLLPYADLTATITPLPELPPVTYLLLSLPLFVGLLLIRRRARA